MKWITRERPKIDRIAGPWLIARFIDPVPEFLCVPPADVLRLAISLGLSRSFADDPAMLAHDRVLCDALCAWCREGRAETHRWPPAM